MSLTRLASVLQDQGDLAAARPLYERAQAILKRAGHPSMAPSLSRLTLLLLDLARCYLSCLLLRIGRPSEAFILGETALTAQAKLFGRDHACTNIAARVTADALDALGRAEDAKELRERYELTSSEDPKPS
jgi:Tetratricopeptide repeat